MKTRINLLFYLLLLSMWGCMHDAGSSNEPVTTVPEISIACESMTDHKVFKETVQLWMENYSSYLSSLGEMDVLNYDSLKAERLHELKEISPSSTRLRAYYLLEEGALSPTVALVNVAQEDCSLDVVEGDRLDFLVVDSNGGSFQDTTYVMPRIRNWRSYVQSRELTYNVYGYNYTWEVISDIITDPSGQNRDLYIHPVLHSISPYDPTFESNLDDELQGYLIFDQVLTYENTISQAAYDFSMPCPRLCGNIISN